MVNILRNVVVGRACSQSSFSPENTGGVMDPYRLVRRPKTGHIAICTARQPQPWWQVDFGEELQIEAAAIFNFDERSKYDVSMQARARSLEIKVSMDGVEWRRCYAYEEAVRPYRPFGGINTGPLFVNLAQVRARYLRLELRTGQVLNLDAVEVYAHREAEKLEAITELLLSANEHNFDLARHNLSAMGLSARELVAYCNPDLFQLSEQGLQFVVQHLLELGAQAEAEAVRERYLECGVVSAEVEASAIRAACQSKDLATARKLYSTLAHAQPYWVGLQILHEEILRLEENSSEDIVKLVIWDLDDTLWKGTLADGDDVELIESRADFIRKSATLGLVNTICSKNDLETAKSKLRQFDLLDLFVLPSISFTPKGERIRDLVELVQLRQTNCLFIDDNHHNLAEVKFVCPSIQVLDGSTAAVEERLEKLLAKAAHDGGKRFKSYKAIEAKVAEVEQYKGDNRAFLEQSDIRVLVTAGTRNLKFHKRIEELVNRSNQMNFTKSRIPPGTATAMIGEFAHVDTRSIFVKDRYGSYGHVGFAAVKIDGAELLHFAFSCRIMNMGIENAIMHQLMQHYPKLKPIVAPQPGAHIRFVTEDDPDFAADLGAAGDVQLSDIRFVSNCQGGILAHYLDMPSRCDVEMWPEIHQLHQQPFNPLSFDPKYRYRIYGIFNEYAAHNWPPSCPFAADTFERRLALTLDEWQKSGAITFVLLPPDSDRIAIPGNPRGGETFTELNRLVRKVAQRFPGVELLDAASFAQNEADYGPDFRKFSRPLLRALAIHVKQRIIELDYASKTEVRSVAA